ncbi:P-loop containing nucleoside triphosphate hydrolase protein [Mycotypha africana]|uniref:P-loop containing nucleoside triphosphate hydrolase protein n=1 Tax=Mycotypha africana TaxID=64632 RepID=UPI002301116B|nr:P-loop containing nucleoside triphosphate hydrolase protein [Mycotypha africana]KAI8984518.1 P-loop containing nucleoside triphosphate hydrolase protein [Mycotypha africana]
MPSTSSRDRSDRKDKDRKEKRDRKEKSDKSERSSRKRDRDEKRSKEIQDDVDVPSKQSSRVASVESSAASTPEPEAKKRRIEDDSPATTVVEEGTRGGEDDDIPENLRLSNFRISQGTIDNLAAKGIKSLFDIQAATFNTIFDGKDVLARARTGTGKTLAFAIPVIERLALDTSYTVRRGRAPRVLVLCPTRDLAKQVCGDFEQVSGNRLKTLPVYGGVPYQEQTPVFRDGVDVVVGTPGRILDHIKFGNMKLHDLKFIILDEADEMLDARGFEEDMFKLLSNIQEQKESRDYQTLLFSATVPESVMETIRRFLKKDYERIDLIGNAKNRTNTNIRHIAMPASYQTRADIIGDVVNVYGRSGLTVIFCATKADANELGAHDKIKQDAAVLHGDIAQSSRESTMKAFREGKYKCIVCTDVLARGLDIPQVDLVINCQPPKDTESYVHRSGRTGRAGRSGVCVTFFKPAEEGLLAYISKRTGVKFEQLSAPRPEDIIEATTEEAFKSIDMVKPDVLPFFAKSAQQLIEKHGAENAVAAALAFMTGYHQGVPSRSLLTSREGQTTLYFELSYTIQHPGYIRNILNREYPEFTYDDFKGWRMTQDAKGVVVDVASEKIEVQEDGTVLLAGRPWDARGITLTAPSQLPPLQERDNNNRGGGGNNYRGGNNGYRGGNSNGYRGNNNNGYRGGGGYRDNNSNGYRGGNGGGNRNSYGRSTRF